MKRRVVRYGPEGVEVVEDVLVDEAPVEFVLGKVPIAVLMRTPGHDGELGLGFAITEGIVLGPHEVDGVAAATGLADLQLQLGAHVLEQTLARTQQDRNDIELQLVEIKS